MKKMLSMMLIMASFVCFTACSEDDEGDIGNPMVGTKWTAGSSSYQVYVIDFPTSSECRDYWTDKSGNTIGEVDYGTYTYNNGNISFYYPNYSNQYNAKVQGDMLIVTLPSGWTRTYIKK